jgi:hypothetical protein
MVAELPPARYPQAMTQEEIELWRGIVADPLAGVVLPEAA